MTQAAVTLGLPQSTLSNRLRSAALHPWWLRFKKAIQTKRQRARWRNKQRRYRAKQKALFEQYRREVEERLGLTNPDA